MAILERMASTAAILRHEMIQAQQLFVFWGTDIACLFFNLCPSFSRMHLVGHDGKNGVILTTQSASSHTVIFMGYGQTDKPCCIDHYQSTHYRPACWISDKSMGWDDWRSGELSNKKAVNIRQRPSHQNLRKYLYGSTISLFIVCTKLLTACDLFLKCSRTTDGLETMARVLKFLIANVTGHYRMV